MLNRFLGDLAEHKGKCLGVLIGLIAGILFLFFGFLKTLFIIFCMAVGFFIGKILDDRAGFENFKHRYFQ